MCGYGGGGGDDNDADDVNDDDDDGTDNSNSAMMVMLMMTLRSIMKTLINDMLYLYLSMAFRRLHNNLKCIYSRNARLRLMHHILSNIQIFRSHA